VLRPSSRATANRCFRGGLDGLVRSIERTLRRRRQTFFDWLLPTWASIPAGKRPRCWLDGEQRCQSVVIPF